MFRGKTPCTVQRQVKTGTDRYGTPTYATQDIAFRGDLAPLDSDEYLAAANQVTTRYRLLAPMSAALVASDRVKVDGLVYEVTGDPGVHRLGGRKHHLEAIVTRVTG